MGRRACCPECVPGKSGTDTDTDTDRQTQTDTDTDTDMGRQAGRQAPPGDAMKWIRGQVAAFLAGGSHIPEI